MSRSSFLSDTTRFIAGLLRRAEPTRYARRLDPDWVQFARMDAALAKRARRRARNLRVAQR